VSRLQRVCVVGIGSPNGDDRLGWLIAAALAHSAAMAELRRYGVEVSRCRHPAVDLLERIRHADLAILIDALRSTAPPGTLYRLEDDEILSSSDIHSSHGLGVASMLALGRALGELPKRLVLYGIAAGGNTPDPDQSALAQRVLAELITKIRRDARVPGLDCVPSTRAS